MSESPLYWLLSTLPGEPVLGIWFLTAREAPVQGRPNGQPVVLKGDRTEWTARPQIAGGGPTRLGVQPYAYTGEFGGEVFASNDESISRDWFLIPGNYEETYLIAADPSGDIVWTATEEYKPIRLERFQAGNASQVFKFIRSNK